MTARPSPVPSPDLPPASVPPFSLSFPPSVSPPRLLLPIHHHQAFHSFFLPPFHFILPTTLVSLSLSLFRFFIFSLLFLSAPHLIFLSTFSYLPSLLLLVFLLSPLPRSPLSLPRLYLTQHVSIPHFPFPSLAPASCFLQGSFFFLLCLHSFPPRTNFTYATLLHSSTLLFPSTTLPPPPLLSSPPPALSTCP